MIAAAGMLSQAARFGGLVILERTATNVPQRSNERLVLALAP